MEKLPSIKIFLPKAIKLILFVTLLLAFSSRIGLADDKDAARNLLEEKLDNVIATLKNKNLDDETKKQKIEDIVKPIFDFPLMTKLALGRASWTAMTKEEQERFIELFTKILKEVYLSKILRFGDEKIIIEGSDQVKGKVYIPTSIVSGGQKVSVLYKFYQSDAGWKIYDFEAQGVSLIQTYRSQFKESLQEMTIKELMVKMEELNSSH